jgi:hypothetical protein
MKLNFLYTKLQLPPEPLIVRYCPQISVFSVLCPQLDLLKPPPNKIPGEATTFRWPSTCLQQKQQSRLTSYQCFVLRTDPVQLRTNSYIGCITSPLTSSLNRRLNCEQSTTLGACVLREQRPEYGVCMGSYRAYANRPCP